MQCRRCAWLNWNSQMPEMGVVNMGHPELFG